VTARPWRCKSCLSMNAPRKRLCEACKTARPRRRRPAHLKALELPYEEYVVLNGGEVCGVCGRAPSASRRLDRDHWHSGPNAGKPRGLACARCNRALPSWVTVAWLEAAAAYLRRAA
jgi:hypothetical protein